MKKILIFILLISIEFIECDVVKESIVPKIPPETLAEQFFIDVLESLYIPGKGIGEKISNKFSYSPTTRMPGVIMYINSTSTEIYYGRLLENEKHTERQLIDKIIEIHTPTKDGQIYIYTPAPPCSVKNQDNDNVSCIEYYREIAKKYSYLKFFVYFSGAFNPSSKDVDKVMNFEKIKNLITALYNKNIPLKFTKSISIIQNDFSLFTMYTKDKIDYSTFLSLNFSENTTEFPLDNLNKIIGNNKNDDSFVTNIFNLIHHPTDNLKYFHITLKAKAS